MKYVKVDDEMYHAIEKTIQGERDGLYHAVENTIQGERKRSQKSLQDNVSREGLAKIGTPTYHSQDVSKQRNNTKDSLHVSE